METEFYLIIHSWSSGMCTLYTMYGQGDMMKHCCNNHMLAYVMLYVGIMKT